MKIINNKKGIELSVNFLVMLILGIAMLSGSLVLANKLFSKAKVSQETVDQSTQNEIRKLITDTDSLVIIYPARKTIHRKDTGTFGVGVQNVKTTDSEDDEFSIAVSYSKSYDKDNKKICEDTRPGPDYQGKIDDALCTKLKKDFIKLGKTTKDIKKNELYSFAILADVPTGTPNGIYIFDVKVCENDKMKLPNPIATKCEDFEEEDLYDKAIHKLYIKVD